MGWDGLGWDGMGGGPPPASPPNQQATSKASHQQATSKPLASTAATKSDIQKHNQARSRRRMRSKARPPSRPRHPPPLLTGGPLVRRRVDGMQLGARHRLLRRVREEPRAVEAGRGVLGGAWGMSHGGVVDDSWVSGGWISDGFGVMG